MARAVHLSGLQRSWLRRPNATRVVAANLSQQVSAIHFARCLPGCSGDRVELSWNCQGGRCFTSTATDTAADPPPAHLSYDPKRVSDVPTLLLIARSAAAAAHLDPGFWRACSMQMQRYAGQSDFTHLARFVEAAARAQYRDDELMYNFGDVAGERLKEKTMDSEGLALVLRAHALLAFNNPRLLEKLEDALYETMEESKATAGGIATSFWSLAQMFGLGVGRPPRRDVLDAVGRMVQEHLPLFSVPQLCEILDGYATYRVQGDRQTSGLLADIGGALAEKYGDLDASQCACAARAYAKCRVHDDRLFSAVGTRLRATDVRQALTEEELAGLLYGLAKFTCQDVALLDLLSIEARRRLHVLDVPTLSTVLSSLAKTGVSSPVLTSRAAAKIKQLDPTVLESNSLQDVSKLVMAFGKLQVRDQKLYEFLGDAILAGKGSQMEMASLEELIAIVTAFTKVHEVHPGLFRAILHLLFERFDEISLPEIVRLVHAIAKVEYVMPIGLQQRIAEALEKRDLAKVGMFELLKLAVGARRLGLAVPVLEHHVSAVLPHEMRAKDASGQGRRKHQPKKHRQSARKRKWDW